MLKKSALFLLFLVVLVGMAAMNTGFFNKKVKMSFINTPDVIMLMGNQDEAKIIELQNKLAKLQAKAGTNSEQQQISLTLQQIAYKDSVQTQDKKVINALVGKIKSLKGIINNNNIMKPKSGRIYAIQFGYNANLVQNTMADMVNNLKFGYVPNMYIFPNDMALLPVYDAKQSTLLSTVEVRLDEATIKYIDKFYSEQLKNR